MKAMLPKRLQTTGALILLALSGVVPLARAAAVEGNALQLHLAILKGDVETVKGLLKAEQALAMKKDTDGTRPFF